MPQISKAERAEREARLAQGQWKCNRCEETKPVDQFYKSAASWSGLLNRCKPCNHSYNAAYRAANRDSILERKRGHYQANRDSIREREREYRLANQDSIRAQHHAYRQANRDRLLEKYREYHAQRHAADPFWRRLVSGATRARKLGVPLEQFNSADLLAYWASQGIDPDRCVYCSGPFEHLDHAFPLQREGTPGHVLSNCVPACASCNCRKQDQTAEEFAADLVVSA